MCRACQLACLPTAVLATPRQNACAWAFWVLWHACACAACLCWPTQASRLCVEPSLPNKRTPACGCLRRRRVLRNYSALGCAACVCVETISPAGRTHRPLRSRPATTRHRSPSGRRWASMARCAPAANPSAVVGPRRLVHVGNSSLSTHLTAVAATGAAAPILWGSCAQMPLVCTPGNPGTNPERTRMALPAGSFVNRVALTSGRSIRTKCLKCSMPPSPTMPSLLPPPPIPTTCVPQP